MQFVDVLQQFIFRERFGQIHIDAGIHGLLPVLRRSPGGNHDDWNIRDGLIGSYMADQFQAVHARHFKVR